MVSNGDWSWSAEVFTGTISPVAKYGMIMVCQWYNGNVINVEKDDYILAWMNYVDITEMGTFEERRAGKYNGFTLTTQE